ncbi:MAG: polysaccharide deacetylase family protein [Bacteroidales bacterium]|jgi:hypothetical protein|nr:polysaccharide deacetylase family protein [Bacteroidales bacterium]
MMGERRKEKGEGRKEGSSSLASVLLLAGSSPRVFYIFRVMMENILRISYRVTTDKEEFGNYEGLKFSYGERCSDELHFGAVSLLFEEGIQEIPLDSIDWNGYRLFFPVEDSALPFDPFALSFYLISRYEEYLLNALKDQHGRFDISGAVAYRNGFHRKPMVNIIACEIVRMLKERYPDFHFPDPVHKAIHTYDVDMAYQYKGKSALRFTASLLKALFLLDMEKVKGLLGKDVDDVYDQFDNHRKNNALRQEKNIHFLLTAPFGRYDRNIDSNSKAFSELVKKLSTFSEIGIHPSYYSSEKPELLSREKSKLEFVYGEKIVKSRQHYLRFSFPSTFRNLIKNGITDDYSLGWSTEVGFRCSTATPYLFYDLPQEKETTLTLHPLTIMDGALAGLTTNKEEQIRIFHSLLDEVKQYGGEFILLQHNSFGEKFDGEVY